MKFVFATLFTLVSLETFAGPAVKYYCQGVDRTEARRATFTVQFSEHVRDYGYATQEVKVISIGDRRVNEMYYLNNRSRLTGCPRGRRTVDLDMFSGRRNHTTFKVACGAEVRRDITDAVCRRVQF